ncbi:MAG TPA: hypothetical protein VGH98_12475 [Gemmatimonadaceae bacterium]
MTPAALGFAADRQRLARASLFADRITSRMQPRAERWSRRGPCQIMGAFMLACVVAVTSTAMVLWYRRRFFSSVEQLATRIEVQAGTCIAPGG